MDNTIYALWLSLVTGPSTSTCRKLIDRFGNDPVSIYKETEYDGLGLTQNAVSKLMNKDLSDAAEIYKRCVVMGISLIVYGDKYYPESLATIPNFPYVLYAKGKIINLNGELCVGMVGTRDMTPYGQKLATELSSDIARSGAIVVSGLAKGIDSASHTACLDNEGYTVAVLGAGIDKAKRWDNEKLFDRIGKNGMLLSEYPPGTASSKITFPQRNRIISGLSQGIVVVEAGLKSGALITADCARKQGRRVFVMTGPTFRSSFEGAVELLKNGAKLITSAEDILGEFESRYPSIGNKDLIRIKREHEALSMANKIEKIPEPEKETPADTDMLDETENKIYELIKNNNGVTADELVYLSGLTIDTVNETLSMLEIYGKICSLAGGRFEVI